MRACSSLTTDACVTCLETLTWLSLATASSARATSFYEGGGEDGDQSTQRFERPAGGFEHAPPSAPAVARTASEAPPAYPVCPEHNVFSTGGGVGRWWQSVLLSIVGGAPALQLPLVCLLFAKARIVPET